MWPFPQEQWGLHTQTLWESQQAVTKHMLSSTSPILSLSHRHTQEQGSQPELDRKGQGSDKRRRETFR